MKNKILITDETIDQGLIDMANRRAARYVKGHRLYGIGFDEVKDDILLELVARRDEINAAAAKGDVVAYGDLLERAVDAATDKASNESKKHHRQLVPYQVRNAEPGKEDTAYADLARDMRIESASQSLRENDRLFIRCVIHHLRPEDRRIAEAYMELGSWKRVATSLGRSEGDFRRHVLPGFIVRFKKEAAKWC